MLFASEAPHPTPTVELKAREQPIPNFSFSVHRFTVLSSSTLAVRTFTVIVLLPFVPCDADLQFLVIRDFSPVTGGDEHRLSSQ